MSSKITLICEFHNKPSLLHNDNIFMMSFPTESKVSRNHNSNTEHNDDMKHIDE